MQINKVFCLFEQSGTFKTAFRNLGIPAEDYDILNDFGQTDHVVDLFAEIEKAYDGKPSLFDEITKDDLIFAFFPCTRFECNITIMFRGEGSQQKRWNDEKRLEYSMKLHSELHYLYMLLCKLCQICLRGGYRLIIENPYTQPHYLTMYFPIKPAVIIKDRHAEGDYYKKPTQFYFLNCNPEQNIVFSSMKHVNFTTKDKCIRDMAQSDEYKRQILRSLMHPQFADRFIKTYILTKDGNIWI